MRSFKFLLTRNSALLQFSVLVVILVSCHSIARSQYSFELTYSTLADENIISSIKHSSGNIYLVGYYGSYQTVDYDPLILKVDPEGLLQSVLWIMNDTNSMFTQIIELDNHNIMLIGNLGFEAGFHFTKSWVRIIDPDLNVVTDHFYNTDTSIISIFYDEDIVDTDGNIVLAGTVYFYDTITPQYATTDFFMAKYSQNGDSLDFRVYDFPGHTESVIDLTAFPSSTDYLAVTSAFFIGMPYPQLVRISSSLEIISTNWLSPSKVSTPCTFDHWLTNSTYIFCGLSPDLNGGIQDDQIGVFKADTNAIFIDILEFGKTDTIDYPAYNHSMEYVNDSTIYIGGFVNYIDFWPTIPNVIELYLVDTNLNLLGYRQFGGDKFYELNGIQKTADGGCLLYACTYSETGEQQRDIHIFKVPRDSINILTHISTLPFEKPLQMSPYPNPVKDIVHFPLGRTYENLSVRIFMQNGKKVCDRIENGSGNLITMNVGYLPAGVYVYNIKSDYLTIVAGKFMKQ